MGSGIVMLPLCYANPLASSVVRPPSQSALLLSTASGNDGERLSFDRVAAAVQTNRVGNLTRQHGGDVFYAFGECDLIQSVKQYFIVVRRKHIHTPLA